MKKLSLFLIVCMMTLAVAMPANAILHWESVHGQQVSMDAYLVFGTYYESHDNPTTDDDADLFWQHYGDSRATVTFTSGALSGTYQIGFGTDWDITTRLMEATWTVNEDLSIAIGKMYAPYYFWSNSRLPFDVAGGGYGSTWDDFDPQFLIKYKGFYLDLKRPVTSSMVPSSSYEADLGNPGDIDEDTVIPRIYVGYNGSFDIVSFITGLGYNTIKVRSDAADFKETIDAWIAMAYVNVAINDMFAVRAGGHYGDNAEEMGIEYLDGITSGGASTTAGAVISGGKVEDTTTFAGMFEVEAKLGNSTVYAGYGYATSDNDTYSENDAHQTYYVNAAIPIHREETTGAVFTVYPEIAVYDEMEDKDGNDEAEHLYVGAVWQVNF